MAKIIIALYVLATSFALIFLKLGSASGAPFTYVNHRPQFNLTWYNSLGFILYGISFLIYTYLISKYDLGYILPLVTAFVYIAIFIASYFIFHEVFTATKILGIVLIFTGLIFLNLKK
jgi:drug/metabolite transporter (DMT)-like permease